MTTETECERQRDDVEVGDKAELCYKGKTRTGVIAVMEYNKPIKGGRVGYFTFEGKTVVDFCVMVFEDAGYFVGDLRDVQDWNNKSFRVFGKSKDAYAGRYRKRADGRGN